MGEKTPIGTAACVLVLVGAINWGLIGLGNFLGGDWNVVNMVLGAWPQVESLLYVLVGLSGVYKLAMCKKCV